MIGWALDAYTAVARAHHETVHQFDAGMQSTLATVVRKVASVGGDQAERVAERLLDPGAYPVDRLAEIAEAWHGPAEQFVRTVYSVVLDRVPDDAELEIWTAGSERPEWRMKVVQEIGRSLEARNRHVPTGWLDALERSGAPARDAGELARSIGALDGCSELAFVGGVYRCLLGRNPDAEGTRIWLAYLRAGASRLDTVRAIAASDEACARGVRAHELTARMGESDPEPALRRLWHLPDELFMRSVYYAVLGREPDGSGLAGYLTRLGASGDRSRS